MSDDGKISLAYMAGFFDGEGCVNFHLNGKTTWQIRIMVVNTHLDILNRIQKTFGGKINSLHKDGNRKPSYCWRLDNWRAIEFLRLIEPFAIVKKEQIIVALKWDVIRNKGQSGNGKPLTQEYKNSIGLLVGQLKGLNKRGKVDAIDLS